MVCCAAILFVSTAVGRTLEFPRRRDAHGTIFGAVPLSDLVQQGGRLTASPIGETPASRLRYDVVLDGAKKHIEKMNDFRGFLRIDSALRAISFARRGDYCCDYPTVDPGETFQEIWHEDADRGLTIPEGNYGLVRTQTWNRIGLKEPLVTRRHGYWSILRPVVIEAWPGPNVQLGSVIPFQPFIIHENVSDDGGYRLVSKRLVGGKTARKVAWSLAWGE